MTIFPLISRILALLLAAGIWCNLAVNSEPIGVSSTVPNIKAAIEQVSLAGKWQMLPGDKSPQQLPASDDRRWQDINVPANWFLQGKDLAGVVWYQHRFTLTPDWQGKVVKLVFAGVDYAADVWLNGQYLGSHTGYFQPFSFLVADKLRYSAENVLVVKVNSPRELPGVDWSLHKRLIKGVLSHHDTRPGGAWSPRGQEQNTGGIWAAVYLQVSEQVAIETLKVTPQINLNQQEASAAVDLAVNYLGKTSQAVKVRLQLQPENFAGTPADPVWETRTLTPGNNYLQFQLHSHNPQLWWTWEHGKPNLYKLKVSIIAAPPAIFLHQTLDRTETIFGFRSIDLDPNTKVLKLNGKRLFLRGTNYISSQWLSEMTPEKYARDLNLIKQANVNAIRVHAHIEAQPFYGLCDRAGILIWQDFPLQWGYTEAPKFITEAISQAKDMVNLLYNHPAIYAWSLHNEPPWDATWMQYKYVAYNPQQNRQLDETLFASLDGIDPTRYLHKYSSISEHPWWGWYSGTWQDYAQPTQEPMITEFGAQALPNLRSLRRIFTAAELWPNTKAKWEKWSYHNFQRHEAFEIARLSPGNNTQEFIDNTQRYQAQLTQFAAESYRRQRFQPVAAIYQFMFSENWSSVNWGMVDYWRQPKPGYEALKLAYQPVLPSIVWQQQVWQQGEPISLDLWAINDLGTSLPKAQLTYSLRRQAQTIKTQKVVVDIAPDSGKKFLTFSSQNLEPGDYKFVVKIFADDGKLQGQNTFKFTVVAKH